MAAPDPLQRRIAAAQDLARTGGRDAPLEVVDYDPAWPQRFLAEVARLADLAPALTPHHIGSTAVPGLAAKPIVDLMSVVADLDAPVSALVRDAGYAFPEAYNATLHRRRWLCYPSARYRTHHLHLVLDADVLGRHLRFRDALRADDRLTSEYADLKRDLARRLAGDREAYTAAKTEFVDRVLRRRP